MRIGRAIFGWSRLPLLLLSVVGWLSLLSFAAALPAPGALPALGDQPNPSSATAPAGDNAVNRHYKPHHTLLYYFWEWIGVICLVLISGISAGLTLGLMSLDETQLYVLSQSGTARQRAYADKIMPIRKNGHLLLVSLLLLNVVVNETLPIISEDALGSGLISIVISTILIVVFSEILPQAICSRHGLAVGAFMAWPVQILIWCFYVIAYPIAKLLDWTLGQHHGIIYRRAELKELINFHAQQQQHGGDLNVDAVTIMRGALDLQEKMVRDAMTVIDDVFCLPYDCRLDRATIERIVESGHSRVPVYKELDEGYDIDLGDVFQYTQTQKRRKIIGCLLVKSLILLDPDDAIPLRDVAIIDMPYVQDDLPLFDILNSFQEGNSHMAIVVPSPPRDLSDSNHAESSRHSADSDASHRPILRSDQAPTNIHHLWSDEDMEKLPPIGVITLEDVLEELIQEPIWDESDVHESAKEKAPRPRAGLAVPLESGARLILATDRGRTRIRPVRAKSQSASDVPEKAARSETIAMQSLRNSTDESRNVRSEEESPQTPVKNAAREETEPSKIDTVRAHKRLEKILSDTGRTKAGAVPADAVAPLPSALESTASSPRGGSNVLVTRSSSPRRSYSPAGAAYGKNRFKSGYISQNQKRT